MCVWGDFPDEIQLQTESLAMGYEERKEKTSTEHWNSLEIFYLPLHRAPTHISDEFQSLERPKRDNWITQLYHIAHNFYLDTLHSCRARHWSSGWKADSVDYKIAWFSTRALNSRRELAGFKREVK